MNSPEFIVPEAGPYDKQVAIDDLNNAFQQLKENAEAADTGVMVEGLPFGPVTKLELIHFTLFHTQRHLHQMEKICKTLSDN